MDNFVSTLIWNMIILTLQNRDVIISTDRYLDISYTNTLHTVIISLLLPTQVQGSIQAAMMCKLKPYCSICITFHAHLHPMICVVLALSEAPKISFTFHKHISAWNLFAPSWPLSPAGLSGWRSCLWRTDSAGPGCWCWLPRTDQ